jgi:hypothetical protein
MSENRIIIITRLLWVYFPRISEFGLASEFRGGGGGVWTPTPHGTPSLPAEIFKGDFGSWTLQLVIICVKNQQLHQFFIQFIYYVW